MHKNFLEIQKIYHNLKVFEKKVNDNKFTKRIFEVRFPWLKFPTNVKKRIVYLNLEKEKHLLHINCNFKNVTHIILHGSYATGDTTNFSDIDILVIVDVKFPSSLNGDIKLLKRILYQLYMIDPLMHHGLFFIDKWIIENFYSEYFLPIETLQNGKILYGNPQINLAVVNDHFLNFQIDRLLKIINSLDNNYIKKKSFKISDWHLKYFISSLLLIPSLILGTKGIFVYKKKSFDLAPEFISDKAWQPIKIAEQIRTNWLSYQSSIISKIIGKIKPAYIPKYYAKIIRPKINLRRNEKLIYKILSSFQKLKSEIQNVSNE